MTAALAWMLASALLALAIRLAELVAWVRVQLAAVGVWP